MDQKISDLDVAISMTASDLIPIVDSNGNNKVLHGSQVKDYVADAVVSDIDDVKAMISDEYDNTATYAVGDYCIYNNTLYRCTTAISTAEDFNPAHWTITSVTSEIERITITGNPATNNPLHFTLETGWSCNDMIVSKCGKQIHLSGTFVKSTVISGWVFIGRFDNTDFAPITDIVSAGYSDDDINPANTKLARYVLRRKSVDGMLQASNDNPNALRILVNLTFEIE